jgi:hypothetical protein
VCVCVPILSIILIMHHAFHGFTFHGFTISPGFTIVYFQREREREREIFHNFCKKSVYVVRIRFCWVDIEK